MSSDAKAVKVTFEKGGGTGRPPTEAIIELGKIVSDAQVLEFSVTRLLGELIGCGIDIAIICFWGLNTKQKSQIAVSLAYQLFSESDPRRALITSAMSKFESISEARNKIVHAFWSEEDGSWMRTYISPSSKKLDLFVGGYPEREGSTQSLRSQFRHSAKEMGEVLDRIGALIADIEGIISFPVRQVK